MAGQDKKQDQGTGFFRIWIFSCGDRLVAASPLLAHATLDVAIPAGMDAVIRPLGTMPLRATAGRMPSAGVRATCAELVEASEVPEGFSNST